MLCLKNIKKLLKNAKNISQNVGFVKTSYTFDNKPFNNLHFFIMKKEVLSKLKEKFREETGLDLYNAAELYVETYGIENYFACDADVLFMDEAVVLDAIEKIKQAALE